MDLLSVMHSTIYRYRRLVAFGPHRLMLRPRDGHDLRLTASELDISPAGQVRWTYDVLGNSVAMVTFTEPASELHITSRLTVERYGTPPLRGEIEACAVHYPFVYPLQDRFDLGRMLEQHHADPADRLGAWARGFVFGQRTDTLALLADLNEGIRAQFGYCSRDEEGTQTPAETLKRGYGTCRDFAVLLAEAARSLGFGARIVSGYLCQPAASERIVPAAGLGTTHAWAEVYVPGPGWIAFDPTNGTVGGEDLIRVAIGRDIQQVVPVAGSFVGSPADFVRMEVEVVVGAALAMS